MSSNYTPNSDRIVSFLAAFRAGQNAIRNMALALLAEVIDAADAVQAKERQSIFVSGAREQFKAKLPKGVHAALFGEGRTERSNKADYKEGTFSPEVADAWSAYNLIGKRAGQFATVRDAIFARQDVADAAALFLATDGKKMSFATLERMAEQGATEEQGAEEQGAEEQGAEDGYSLDKFTAAVAAQLAAAEKAGFLPDALAALVGMVKERAAVAQ
jgi:hypothetical protein